MKKITLFGFAFLSLMLGACSNDTNEAKSSNSSEAASSEISTEASLATSASSESSTAGTYKDRTLDVPDGTLKITGFERGQDYEGNPMFYVFFDLTNKSDEAQNVQMLYMSFVSASQNTGATTEDLEMSMMMDNPYQEKADLLQKDLNPGQTISGVYYYNFADDTKPVTFEFSDALFSLNGPVATEEIEIP